MANEQVTVRFAAEIQQYQANVKQAQKLLSMFGITAEQESNRVARSVASMVAQYASLTLALNAVKNVVKEGINFNKFVEVSTAAFGTMMKSVSGAKAVMQDLFNFAVNSPLTFKETVASSRQLMAYGFQVKELIPTIQILGTVGKATGVSLDDMAYVYGTLRSQGRAYTRDLMQFAMRGIPIYEELAKVMGRPVSELQKMTEAGKIGFKEVEKAFQNMTSGTGKFSGYFDEYMKTFEGKMSMLSDIAQQASGTLTESLFDVLKTNVDDFIKILGNNKEQISALGTDLGNLASGFFDIVKAVIPLVPLLVKLIPLLIAKELISTGLKFWKALPETFNLIGGAIGPIITKLTAMANGAAFIPGMSSSFTMLTRAVSELGIAFTTAFPEILAASLVIGGIVVSIMAIVDAFNKAENIRKTQESYRTNKAAATESVSRLGKDALIYDINWDTGQRTKTSIQGQVQAVEELRRVYSALSVNELADILLKNKAISKEAADLIAKLYPIESGASTAISYGLSLIEQQAAGISETMNVAQSMFTRVKDVLPKGGALAIPGKENKYKEFTYTGKLAAIEFLKGFADSAKTADKTNSLLGILPDPADLKKAYTKELDAIVSTVDTLGAMKQKDGTPLFDLSSESLMGPLRDRVQLLLKLLADVKTTVKTVKEVGIDMWSNAEWNLKGVFSEDSIGKAEAGIERLRVEYEKFKNSILTNDKLGFDRNAALLQLEVWYQNEKLKIEGQGAKDAVTTVEVAADEMYNYMENRWDSMLTGSENFWKALKGDMSYALENKNLGLFMKAAGMASLQGTYAGKIVQGFEGRKAGEEGNTPMSTGMNLLVTGTQIAGDALSVLGKFIWDIVMAAKPMQDLLKAITTSVAYALMPVIETLANGLSWLYDSIIVPVGNFIIDIINAIIRFVNKVLGWAGVNINEMNHLLTTTQALAKAQEDAARQLKLSKSMDAFGQTLDYLKNKLNATIDTQVKSLQDLYEVGAISAQDYQGRVGALNANRPAGLENMVSIADQQLATMQEVSTRIGVLLGIQQYIKNNKLTDDQALATLMSAGITENIKPLIANPPQLTVDLGGLQTDVTNTINTIVSAGTAGATPTTTTTTTTTATAEQIAAAKLQIDKLGEYTSQLNPMNHSYASGTGYIPQDMPANVHKGEMIIPSDFSSAIRRGDLSLSGSSPSGGAINVVVNVAGSVKEENDLAKTIANAIYRQRRAGLVTV